MEDLKQNIDINFKTNAEETAVKTDKVADSTDKVVKKTKEVSAAQKETQETTKNLTSSLDNMTGGAVTGFQNMVKGLKGIVTGFRTLGGAIMMTGLGALVVVIGSLIAAFSSSEEGQNKFASLMAVIGSVVGNVMDVLSDFGEFIIDLLSGDSKAIQSAKEFGIALWNVVGLPIKNVIDIAKTAGKVLGSLFSLDVKGAITDLKNGVKDVKQNFEEAGKSINSAKNSLVEFGKEALREAQIAKQIAADRAKADVLERNLIVDKAEAERRRAELLEKAIQVDRFSQKERIGFLKEAGKLDEEITAKQIQSAILRRDALIEENKLSKSNKDALKAEEEAKAEVIRLETARLQRAKEVTGQIQGLISQEAAASKALADQKKAQLDAELAQRKAFLEQIKSLEQQYAEQIQDLQDKTEEEKLARQKERDLAEIEQLRLQGANVEELLRLNAEKYNILETELRQQRQTEKEAQELEFWEKEAEEALERQAKLREIDELQLQHKRELNEALENLESTGFATAKLLFEKNKGVQRGLLIAENAVALAKVGIDTASAVTKSVAASPLTGGMPFSGVAIATGALSAVNIIASTAKGLKALGGGGASSSPAPAQSVPATPQVSFQNSSENQIANSMTNARQSQQPVQAYVVSQEVTNAQQIDRNRINGNSF